MVIYSKGWERCLKTLSHPSKKRRNVEQDYEKKRKSEGGVAIIMEDENSAGEDEGRI